MIRDGKMAALVDAEPITPFVSRVRGMREGGISCVLVIGGSGDYLNVADAVIGMKVRGEFKGEEEGREGENICMSLFQVQTLISHNSLFLFLFLIRRTTWPLTLRLRPRKSAPAPRSSPRSPLSPPTSQIGP